MANYRSLSEREKEQLVRDMTDTTTSAYGDDAWKYPSSLKSSLAKM